MKRSLCAAHAAGQGDPSPTKRDRDEKQQRPILACSRNHQQPPRRHAKSHSYWYLLARRSELGISALPAASPLRHNLPPHATACTHAPSKTSSLPDTRRRTFAAAAASVENVHKTVSHPPLHRNRPRLGTATSKKATPFSSAPRPTSCSMSRAANSP